MASTSYKLITKIAYAFMLFTLLTAVTMGFADSFLNLEVDVDKYNEEAYTRMVILENILALDFTDQTLQRIHSGTDGEPYTYQRQGSVIPAEYFMKFRKGATIGGYKKAEFSSESDEEICYIESVPMLDGENFGFYMTVLDQDMRIGEESDANTYYGREIDQMNEEVTVPDSEDISENIELDCILRNREAISALEGRNSDSIGTRSSAPALLLRNAYNRSPVPVRIHVWSLGSEGQ